MTDQTHPDSPSGQPYSAPRQARAGYDDGHNYNETPWGTRTWGATGGNADAPNTGPQSYLPPPDFMDAHGNPRLQTPLYGNGDGGGSGGKEKRSWPARHKIRTGLLAAAALLLLVAVIAAVAGSGQPTPLAAAKSSAAVTAVPPAPKPSGQDAATSAPVPSRVAPKPPKPAAPKLTAAQENAIGTAKDYLTTSHFSRTGLIDQLVFEQYSKADATFAVNYLHVDFKVQAVGTAKDYLDTGHFSRGSLVEQLAFEGYTQAEATYAADKVGL